MEKMEIGFAFENDLNLEATELTLGLPGTHETEQHALSSNVKIKKRSLPEMEEDCRSKRRISESQQTEKDIIPTEK